MSRGMLGITNQFMKQRLPGFLSIHCSSTSTLFVSYLLNIQSELTLFFFKVAAGGGSCLTYKNGLFRAGPESAGAHPGPACYRKGGPLALTDGNLFLGRLIPK